MKGFVGLWNHQGWDSRFTMANHGQIQAMAQQNVEVGILKLKLFKVFFWGSRPGVKWFLGPESVKLSILRFLFFFNCEKGFLLRSRSFFGGEKNHEARSSLLTVAGARSSTFYRGARCGACWDPEVLNGKFYGKGWFRALVIFGDKDVFANSEWTMKWNDCELCWKK